MEDPIEYRLPGIIQVPVNPKAGNTFATVLRGVLRGYVNPLIRQEVNSATAEVQVDAPVISTRETETEVLVKDGQTVVLGGLREHCTRW